MTRVEYSAIVEVPDETSPDELDRLADTMYDEVDGSEYYADTDYWEAGERYVNVAVGGKPSFRYVNGKLIKQGEQK